MDICWSRLLDCVAVGSEALLRGMTAVLDSASNR